MSKLFVVNIVMLLLVVIVLVFGSPTLRYEHFDGEIPAIKVKNKNVEPLKGIEQELFADLKDNKLSEQDIKQLILDGVLTDTLVDKFLSRLNFPVLTSVTKPTKTASTDQSHETHETFVDKIEPFTDAGTGMSWQSASW